ncbi:MAG: DNA polymerase IV [Candidatus Andersenbacteria bacterium]
MLSPTPQPGTSSANWSRAILHIDADAFFASCEQAIHPELRGKPVVVGYERGVVTAASYPAKALGVTRGMPTYQVRERFPSVIIAASTHGVYGEFSDRMFEVIEQFSPTVEAYSVDEAFVDVTGLLRVHHARSYHEIAAQLQRAVRNEVGIGVSIGVASTKVLAKVGSKHDKPDGCVELPPGTDGRMSSRTAQILAATPAGRVWGIGYRTAKHLEPLGIRTALDFARLPIGYVRDHFAEPFVDLWRELNGQPRFQLHTHEKETYGSMRVSRTFWPATNDRAALEAQLMKNLESVCARARRYEHTPQAVSVFLKDQGFHITERTAPLTRPSVYPSDIAPVVRRLFNQLHRPRVQYRTTCVTFYELVPAAVVQQSLFEPPAYLDKLARAYAAVDRVARRFGKHTVHLLSSTPAYHVRDTSGRELGALALRRNTRSDA